MIKGITARVKGVNMFIALPFVWDKIKTVLEIVSEFALQKYLYFYVFVRIYVQTNC